MSQHLHSFSLHIFIQDLLSLLFPTLADECSPKDESSFRQEKVRSMIRLVLQTPMGS
jgi:hypothetical protein